MDLMGKTVLVTGGGSGIGLGIALALAREGCRVAITGRDEPKLQRAAARFSGKSAILYRACDVGDRADVARLFAWLDQQGLAPLDILVTSAGVNTPKRQFAELDPEDWDRLLRINTTGAFFPRRIPDVAARNGLIVNSSIAGATGRAGRAAYAARSLRSPPSARPSSGRANGIHVTNIYPAKSTPHPGSTRPPLEKLLRCSNLRTLPSSSPCQASPA